MPSLVEIHRGGMLESFHTGSIVVVDSAGQLIAFAGDPAEVTCIRSSAKPFQALTVLLEGAADEFDLTPEELALVCASHGGESHHVATAAAILRKGDFDESDLLCGAHAPLDERAALELRLAGEAPSALHNNCSGKHAGMLLTSRLLQPSPKAYLDSEHPIQQLNHQTLAEFAALAPTGVPFGVDGCGVPAYFMSLYRAALAYARFAATAFGAADPEGLPRYADGARDIFEAMTGSPEYVAGSWSITTPLMASFDRNLLSKEGAEGFYAMAIAPSLVDELDVPFIRRGSAIGVAIKIHDGSMRRGRDPVILAVLRAMGVDVASKPQLQPYLDRRILNAAGKAVGEWKTTMELEIL